MKQLLFATLFAFLLIGCANKKIEKETALQWHRTIFKNLTSLSLDKADDAFTSLEVEHPESKFIPIDMIQLSLAHAKQGEYQLAIFYMREFKNRYASYSEKEWADYMIAKYKFFSIQEAYTNQKGLNDALNFVKDTIRNYPNSIYNYELRTMEAKLELTKKLFRENISELYERIGKPKSAEIYKTEIDKSKVIPPQIPWYRKIFYW